MVWRWLLALLVVVLSTCTIVLVIRDGRGPQQPPGSHYADPVFGAPWAAGGWPLGPPVSAGRASDRVDRSGPLVQLVERAGLASPGWETVPGRT